MPKSPKSPTKGGGSVGKPKLGGGMASNTARGMGALRRAAKKEEDTRSRISSLSGPAQGAADGRNRRVTKAAERALSAGVFAGSSNADVARSVNKKPNADLETMARQIEKDANNQRSVRKEAQKMGSTRSEAMKKAWMTRRRKGGARGG